MSDTQAGCFGGLFRRRYRRRQQPAAGPSRPAQAELESRVDTPRSSTEKSVCHDTMLTINGLAYQ